MTSSRVRAQCIFASGEGSLRPSSLLVDFTSKRITSLNCTFLTHRNGASAFTGLDQDITPLYPIESRGEVDGVSFTRIQVPMTPAFAITDFKSQGKSVAEACVDIKTSHTNKQ